VDVRPKPPTNKAPADRFTGDVWTDIIAEGHGPTPMHVGSVHFTPGSRTAWHKHGIGQTLYVTDGEGRIQPRGEPVVTIRAGDILFAPAGEWHWHGAAPDHFMTHLAVGEGDSEWGELVTDAEYNA